MIGIDTLAMKNKLMAGGADDALAEAITASTVTAIEGGVATKADLTALKADMDVGFAEMDTKFAEVRTEIAVAMEKMTRRVGYGFVALVPIIGALFHFMG